MFYNPFYFKWLFATICFKTILFESSVNVRAPKLLIIHHTPHTLYCIEKWINGWNAAWSRSVMRKGRRFEARRMNGRRRRIPQTLAPGWITYPQTHTAVTGPFCTITCCYHCPLARSPRVRSVTTTPAGARTCTHPLTPRFLLLLETANRN